MDLLGRFTSMEELDKQIHKDVEEAINKLHAERHEWVMNVVRILGYDLYSALELWYKIKKAEMEQNINKWKNSQ